MDPESEDRYSAEGSGPALPTFVADSPNAAAAATPGHEAQKVEEPSKGPKNGLSSKCSKSGTTPKANGFGRFGSLTFVGVVARVFNLASTLFYISFPPYSNVEHRIEEKWGKESRL